MLTTAIQKCEECEVINCFSRLNRDQRLVYEKKVDKASLCQGSIDECPYHSQLPTQITEQSLSPRFSFKP